uniref:Uncharacterized protein n=1 Tax=Romanomermis culicivorax TaxID=13658 RepID=A0A915JH99_ROMCU
MNFAETLIWPVEPPPPTLPVDMEETPGATLRPPDDDVALHPDWANFPSDRSRIWLLRDEEQRRHQRNGKRNQRSCFARIRMNVQNNLNYLQVLWLYSNSTFFVRYITAGNRNLDPTCYPERRTSLSAYKCRRRCYNNPEMTRRSANGAGVFLNHGRRGRRNRWSMGN